MKLLAFSAIVGLTAANQIEWMQFKELHGKAYSGVEDAKRYNIFMDNKQFVARHNALYASGKESYTVGMNKNADLTAEEFSHRYLAEMQEAPGIRLNYQCPVNFSPSMTSYPDTVDWRAGGNQAQVLVTPVKDQGSCGSCWSFGGTGTLEGSYCKANTNVDCGSWSGISEQNLVDCGGKDDTDLGPYYDMACNGGWIDNALYYVQVNGGIDSEDSYPYVSGSTKKAGTCVYDASNSVTTMSTCGATTKNSETELMQALAEVGPVGIAIDAGGIGFQLYTGGVYISNTCSATHLNHAVLAVGYGNESGQDYFIVKNSWGTAWGDNGYILMARNRNNQCGVAATPAYAMV